ncbi:glycosyltransferase family 4 protein [Rhizobium sp. SL86]|uniref:glycosyltransferase family 4 protein n=1 Tax=Rhizobium sp. SL86 TaxID=2995148 RepID=UPI002276B766|nr:glycosyltransferase family 4 protein [Rhizobium sp. SL86]MCY1666973.1 glycosyltransferase family 4 protein [Rhizobium sp. SL86]
MKIAFYAPLKSPDHPVPSGDRLMARQLLRALRQAGHVVEVVSQLRAYSASSDVPADQETEAAAERERIAAEWRGNGAPDLWFCYHPYYKAPDRLGPLLCNAFAIPYVTAECSYSDRRNIGGWAQSQALVRDGVKQAAVNLCLTERDRRGLQQAVPEARLERLSPFIDAAPFLATKPQPEAGHLVTVAMMRPGDKFSSYTALAAALSYLLDEDWTLSLVGDGPERTAVERLFATIPAERLRWHGELKSAEIGAVLSSACLYVWPGHGEAYGLAYLEAQAARLPVVAEAVAGVPEVVLHERTGLLTAPGDPMIYADAIRQLLRDPARRQIYANAARQFVTLERSLDGASETLDRILRSVVKE